MFIKKVISCISSHDMLKKGDFVLIATSGGPDSTCLAYILDLLKEKFEIKIALCHFNHKLRKNSYDDLKFVEDQARNLGCEFYCEEWDDPVRPQREARIARYKFFEKIAKEVSANKIALGHNLDDCIETIIFHLIRGEGPLSIPPKRELDFLTFIRPLISIERKEIEVFLSEKNISFVNDPSNKELAYTRNKIRNILIPMISELNPSYKKAFVKLSKIWEGERDYFKKEVEKIIKEIRTEDGLSIKTLSKYHPAIIAHILREKQDIGFSQINEVLRFISKRSSGTVELGGGKFIKRKRDKLIWIG